MHEAQTPTLSIGPDRHKSGTKRAFLGHNEAICLPFASVWKELNGYPDPHLIHFHKHRLAGHREPLEYGDGATKGQSGTTFAQMELPNSIGEDGSFFASFPVADA